ncbi:MAG: S46 family peptidase [Prevotellaceae bacterium]|jgi:hypothetical protein|nr:S46 family peptidase [Prevotellaceae bacterium]
MKQRIIWNLLLLLCAAPAKADEGMWLPSLIGARMADMQAKGLKLSADDIYSINRACLKDAIVQFDGGCTAELISDKGLLLTNHHCGLDYIQAHSTETHDYLKNGFWAANPGEELPCKGLRVRFLMHMTDVTAQALKGVTARMTGTERTVRINKNKAAILKAETKEPGTQASIESLYYGNRFYLFVYRVFDDVRLVGAPPSAIGKFGGDTDNWIWPRHTGDFSLFRIYAGKDNQPAEYAPGNVAYRPKTSLRISLKGFRENDFTFIYGVPGRTSEYLYSEAVRYIVESGNPAKIRLRDIRLRIMKAGMENDVATRIKYTAKQAAVANAWKKWQGELKGLTRLKTVEKKQALETQFAAWAAGKPEYDTLLPRFAEYYSNWKVYAAVRDYQTEAFNAIEIIRYAAAFAPLAGKSDTPDTTLIRRLRTHTADFFKDYAPAIDRQTCEALLTEYLRHVPAAFIPPALNDAHRHSGSVAALCDTLYARTLFTSREAVEQLLRQTKSERTRTLLHDPLFALYRQCDNFYKEAVEEPYRALQARIDALYRDYLRGLMAFQPHRDFYPDANATLRIAYGKVAGYTPVNAVYYLPQSTIEGIMEKDNPDIYDYNIPQRLRDIVAARDYGRWAGHGTVPVAFIATNHTTGGNSGSPVLNGNGELIGLNFDRTWESTMSDVEYDPAICRNIAVDIRYVLFVIDKVAGADYLLHEMNFAL